MDLHRALKVASLAAWDDLPCPVVLAPMVWRLRAAAVAARPAPAVLGLAAGSVGVGSILE